MRHFLTSLLVTCVSGFAVLAQEADPGGDLPPQLGEPWTVPELGMQFVPVDPGTFTMGAVNADWAATVHLTNPFWVGVHEVTQAQYRNVMGVVPQNAPARGDSLPVSAVSWEDAQAFCRILTRREEEVGRLTEGLVYRLATAAEWEYCARAGCPRDYIGELEHSAWYHANSGMVPHAVATKEPNEWGLHDMIGNVGEWCLDWYGWQPGPLTDPRGPDEGRSRVYRGGSFRDNPIPCRAWSRYAAPPSRTMPHLGFRVVLALDVDGADSYADYIARVREAEAKGAGGTPTFGEPWTVPELGMELVAVKPGAFRMSRRDFLSSRQPTASQLSQESRIFRKPLWIGKHEVTQAEYAALGRRSRRMPMGGGMYQGFKEGDRFPAIAWQWREADEFCRRLTTRERGGGRLPSGYVYRLPTEAEWEYAARAGQAADAPADLDSQAWSQRNSNREAHEVGTKEPNSWGVHDMAGSVWEWCHDADPPGRVHGASMGGSGPNRVLRGGSWRQGPVGWWARRVTRRMAYMPATGFRVVLAPGEPEGEAPPTRPETSVAAAQDKQEVQALGPVAGKEWSVPELGLKLMPIGAGAFRMGSEDGRDDQSPVHDVRITKPFWLGRVEVTQAEYRELMALIPSAHPGDRMPVESLSWEEAVGFCVKLTGRERKVGRLPAGYVYRLPTEAEWEYACGAGQQAKPDADLSRHGWCASSRLDRRPCEVGQKLPNLWGLHDMHGNVAEWCWDRYGTYAAEPQIDPTGAAEGDQRVARGGSHASPTEECLAASRRAADAGHRGPDVGFRVALAPDTVGFVKLEAEREAARAAAVAEDASRPEVGKPWTVPGFEIELAPLPPGTFRMGTDEGGGFAGPLHEVRLSRPVWIGKREVTQRTYEAVLGKNPSYEKGGDLPVFQVSWAEAVAFCRQLTERGRSGGFLPETHQFRLPTEAEWEYACRAGGEGTAVVEGWHQSNSEDTPHPVGAKPANAWGLHDMLGNVREWCLDWYGPYVEEGASDPRGPETGSFHVTRGGSFADPPEHCRPTVRSVGALAPENGFRVVLGPSVGRRWPTSAAPPAP